MRLLNKEQIERIVFSKYLLSQAKTQRNKGIPLNSFTILILHDAVEIFLQVALEIHVPEIKKEKTKILESMASAINEALSTQENKINIQYIKRLNDRRNGLKHATIFVNTSDIQNLYSETEMFFKDFSKPLFNVSFSDISLVSIIPPGNIQDHLHQAREQQNAGYFIDAMISITKAYHYLERSVKDGYRPSTLIRDYRMRYSIRTRTMSAPSAGDEVKWLSEQLERDIGALANSVSTIEKAMYLGVDLKAYNKFRKLLPDIYFPNTQDTDDKLNFFELTEQHKSKYTFKDDDVSFCFDFVLEIALNNTVSKN